MADRDALLALAARVERVGPAVLYLADCRDLVPTLAAADALVSDPPYGIGYRVNARARDNTTLDAIADTATEAKPAIAGDDAPFDPSAWLAMRKIALFGANYFADRLPRGGKWIVWDKRDGSAADDHSDCELIWTNLPGALRIHRQKWRGVVRAGEENCSRSKKLHPNQKPVALLDFIIGEMDLQPGAVIADPYMGSGSTGVVAMRRGFGFIGCEIDPQHFETAVARLRNEAAALRARAAEEG